MGMIELLLVLFVIIIVFVIVVARSKNGNKEKEKVKIFKEKLSKTDSERKVYKIAEDGTIIRD